MVARYRLTVNHFFEPEIVKAGEVIEYAGEPNEGMVPLNAEAEAALDKFIQSRPGAGKINPVTDLPRSMVTVIRPEPEVRRIDTPENPLAPPLTAPAMQGGPIRTISAKEFEKATAHEGERASVPANPPPEPVRSDGSLTDPQVAADTKAKTDASAKK